MKLKDIKLGKDENLIIQEGFAFIDDFDGHLKRIFEVADGEFTELNLEAITEKIADYLKDKVDIKKFLIDFLSVKTSPKALMELKERVEKKAAVQDREGCYYINVYGKHKPIRLYLVKPNWLTD